MTFTLPEIVQVTEKILVELEAEGVPPKQIEIIELGFLSLRAELGIMISQSVMEKL